MCVFVANTTRCCVCSEFRGYFLCRHIYEYLFGRIQFMFGVTLAPMMMSTPQPSSSSSPQRRRRPGPIRVCLPSVSTVSRATDLETHSCRVSVAVAAARLLLFRLARLFVHSVPGLRCTFFPPRPPFVRFPYICNMFLCSLLIVFGIYCAICRAYVNIHTQTYSTLTESLTSKSVCRAVRRWQLPQSGQQVAAICVAFWGRGRKWWVARFEVMFAHMAADRNDKRRVRFVVECFFCCCCCCRWRNS